MTVEPAWEPPEIDTSKANIARVCASRVAPPG